MLTNIKAVMMVNKITVLLSSYQCLAGNCADTTTFDQEIKPSLASLHSIQQKHAVKCFASSISNLRAHVATAESTHFTNIALVNNTEPW